MSENNLLENEDCQIVTSAEGGLFTVSVFNPNSPSNSDLLEDTQNVDSIPQILTNTTSCFDLSNLPKIETLDSLLKNLCEVMVRFDGSVKDYQKADFEQLIKIISNSLIYLYTNTSLMNTGNHAVGFRGIAHLDTNPYLEAIELNNSYPGIYFAQDIGTYPYFSVDVTSTDNFDAIVLLVPYINSNGEVVRYDKSVYNLNISNPNFTYSPSMPSSVWVIQHNLNKKPTVVITDRDGYLCEGQILYTDNNNVTITFSAPLEGYADLN